MGTGLVLVLITVGLLVVAVLGKKDFLRDGAAVVSVLIFLVGGLVVDQNLTLVIFFGTSVALMQALVADPFLTKRTLTYKASATKLRETPHWMLCLWAVALGELAYVWILIESKFEFTLVAYACFVAAGTAYFLVFEILVGNHAKWWSRHDCLQIGNVAIYALIAECLTVAALPWLVSIIFKTEMDFFEMLPLILLVGTFYGCVVAMTFCALCEKMYKPSSPSTRT